VRTLETIEDWLAAGIDRVYMGTAAVENPELVREACLLYPGRVGVGADARAGRTAVRGWKEGAGPPVLDFVEQMVASGAAFVSYTDISRDGTLHGPDIAGLRSVAAVVPAGVELILAGGVGSLAHVLEAAGEPRLDGIIIGRALYDARLDFGEALLALAGH
jgi:phosphoribosylformimino-5-aminoimidazole carboxamide ribotide isomerase